MKSTFSKILGIAVTLTILASLLVTGTALPASAAVGTLAYGTLSTPGASGKVLVGGADVDFLVATADGKTLFAYDQGVGLYKSTNAGATFATRATGSVGLIPATVVTGMVISPTFATDNTVVVTEAQKVWISTDGGANFYEVSTADLQSATKLSGGTISSVDMSAYYATGKNNILIGVIGGAGVSKVIRFDTGTAYGVWTSVGTLTNDVYAVKFSPAHTSDAEILALASNGVDAALYSSFAGAAFSVANAAVLTGTAAPADAIIAMGTDYNGFSASNTIAIGISGGGAPGLWRVMGRTSATAGTAENRYPAVNVQSVAINGPIASATVMVGVVGSPVLYRNATFTTATTVFTPSNKSPTGSTGVSSLVMAGSTVFAGTTGADSAVSVSTDGGVNFVQTALIDVGTLANVSIVDVTVADANNIFVIMNNPAGAPYAARSVFRTTDGGATWTRVLINDPVAGPVFAITSLAVSPAYATDKTVYVSQGAAGAATVMIFKSVDNGITFTPMIAAELSSKIFAVDGNNLYYSGATGTTFYKLGTWTSATFPAGTSSPVFSIAMNPKDATKATFAVGLNNGRVYQSTNSGVSFTAIGTTTPQGTNTDAVYVAYGPDGSLYALGSGASGIYRWTGTAWLDLQAGITNGTALAVTADGTLYASSATAGTGIYRSLYPTLGDVISVAACEFQALNSTNFAATYLGTYVLADLAVASTKTDNTLYVVETTTAVDSPAVFGYLGRVYGFKDTFIVGPTLSTPKDKAQITTEENAALAWAAYTSATNYQVQVGTSAAFTTVPFDDDTTKTSQTTTDVLDQGTTYFWRVRATSVQVAAAPINNINSRWSTVQSFVTALFQPTVSTVQEPTQGATDVPVDTTFTWPASDATGATYEFVIAEELGNADKFSIIDDSATTTTNGFKLREPLKYDTQYWWRVRTVTATSKSDWTTSFFTTEKEPVAEVTTPVVTPTVIVTQPAPIITVTVPPAEKAEPVIPTYLLWAVIAVGAILVIAVIVLIVRTRRVS